MSLHRSIGPLPSFYDIFVSSLGRQRERQGRFASPPPRINCLMPTCYSYYIPVMINPLPNPIVPSRPSVERPLTECHQSLRRQKNTPSSSSAELGSLVNNSQDGTHGSKQTSLSLFSCPISHFVKPSSSIATPTRTSFPGVTH